MLFPHKSEQLVRQALYGMHDTWADVTSIVNTLLRFGDGVPVSNLLCGDPVPNVPKVLRCELANG
ncbi:MAG: hypothetical protein SFV23_19935, partial [Planctomycetaceae bacterium]|nr:hypothetical protein [Planctomycetaceae bacterium]